MHPKVLLLAAAATTLSLTAHAQSAPISGAPLIVASAPFSAQEWTTITFNRSDGTAAKILRRVDVARNSAGSTRREFRILANSSTAAQPTGSLYADIHDVPNNLAVHLVPAASTATVNPLRKSAKPYIFPGSVPVGAVVAAPAQTLGFSSIAGFTASGSRQTLLFPKGTKSDSQEVTQTTDTWYSSDLKSVLLTETTDSLNNSTVTALTQIDQSEPDPTLFTIPANYTTTVTGKSAQSPE